MLTVSILAAPPIGTAVVVPPGDILYTPPPNWSGTTALTYGISDGRGGSASGRVTRCGTPIADAPLAFVDNATRLPDTPMVIDVAANDDDADGRNLARHDWSRHAARARVGRGRPGSRRDHLHARSGFHGHRHVRLPDL